MKNKKNSMLVLPSPLVSCTTNNQTKREMVPNIVSENCVAYYGLYPQTHVNDRDLIAKLFSLKKSEKNGYYFYDGSYYAKKSASPSFSYNTFSDGTEIVKGTTYWFKCEPIEWKILSSDNGTYSLVSTVLLDAHQYYSSTSNRTIDGKTVCPNNYKYSDIRSWLNDDFYNAAFSLLDSSYIQTVEVDNSASITNSSTNENTYENTKDKVYLLSYNDYKNASYFPDNASRYCEPTDYAKANGAYCSTSSLYNGNGWYWTRSPYGYPSAYAWGVDSNGFLNSDYVNVTYRGVRPAITIKI